MLEELTVLGANSALPIKGRFSSSFVLKTTKRSFLIDAGEGCQMKLGEFHVKRSKISHVFISHLHGDHVFGLPGIITSFNLNGRKENLTIYGPLGIKEFIETIIRLSSSYMGFDLNIIEIEEPKYQTLFEIEGIQISAFPLKHRVPTFGYKFQEITTERNVISDMIKKYTLSIEEIKKLKRGEDLQRDQEDLPNSELTYTKRPKKSFAYCSDTIYDESIIPYVDKSDTIYHEATYLDIMRKQADERMHTTALGAAQIALKADCKRLIIGHFSSRYDDLTPLLEESQSVFDNVYLAHEGAVFSF